MIQFISKSVKAILDIGIVEARRQNKEMEQKIRSLSQIMNIESGNEDEDYSRPSPFREDGIGSIDDISIGSIKNREKYEI